MNSEQINYALLEKLTFSELVKLADEYGVDVPQDLDRRFLIAELLELAEEESTANEIQMNITMDNDNLDDFILPKNYNETKIGAVLRNPAWLFVFWNISDSDFTKIKSNKSNMLKLRVCSYHDADEKTPFDTFEVQIADDSQEQYVLLPKDVLFVKVELLLSNFQNVTVLSVSSSIKIPKVSLWIKNFTFKNENSFSPVLIDSGIKELLIKQFENHRHSFI